MPFRFGVGSLEQTQFLLMGQGLTDGARFLQWPNVIGNQTPTLRPFEDPAHSSDFHVDDRWTNPACRAPLPIGENIFRRDVSQPSAPKELFRLHQYLALLLLARFS
ncbi:hypothetical protein [Acidisarcina polymorpha]|uniref:hypothetical protein n=1 Tax=Acidisarcina polymorpha TaxID=2211140 RepID=UPI001F21BEAF|nr:hypothetical protein [Acidisarcina polymorpha]